MVKPSLSPTSTPAPSSPNPSSFEDAMVELETIVQGMDDEKVPLESLLEQYARGRQLITFCQEKIDDAQQRVDLITAGPIATLTPLNSDSSNTNRPAKSARATAADAPEDDIRLS